MKAKQVMRTTLPLFCPLIRPDNSSGPLTSRHVAIQKAYNALYENKEKDPSQQKTGVMMRVHPFETESTELKITSVPLSLNTQYLNPEYAQIDMENCELSLNEPELP